MERQKRIGFPDYWVEAMGDFTDSEAGQLFRAAMKYVATGEEPDEKYLNTSQKIAWRFMKRDLDWQDGHPRSVRYPEDVRGIRNSTEYKQWREAVFERDHYTCQICGKVGCVLNAHHIKPFAKFPSMRFKVTNGITLCKDCHIKVHKGEVKCPTVFLRTASAPATMWMS